MDGARVFGLDGETFEPLLDGDAEQTAGAGRKPPLNCGDSWTKKRTLAATWFLSSLQKPVIWPRMRPRKAGPGRM